MFAGMQMSLASPGKLGDGCYLKPIARGITWQKEDYMLEYEWHGAQNLFSKITIFPKFLDATYKYIYVQQGCPNPGQGPDAAQGGAPCSLWKALTIQPTSKPCNPLELRGVLLCSPLKGVLRVDEVT